RNIAHWHLAESPRSIDCFMNLTRRIECERTIFFEKMSEKLAKNSPANASYLKGWLEKKSEARAKMLKFFNECPWSDFYAIGQLLKIIPRKWHLQLSNGTSVRYAQLFDYSAIKNIECNRGVSGIDGSTSTAIGAHIYYADNTLLITGDMSAQYDLGALALQEITPRFKMAVLNNQGGGIFRYIKSTSKLDECEECFAGSVNLPLQKLAEAYGFAYFEASDKVSLDKSFGLFAAEKQRPAILNIITPPDVNTEILNKFFNQQKNNSHQNDETNLADN
ncbi:MAG: 2-succinyl-5-enolpyruvyl-6-hydroxy-3-cyclohexene-1-carboxylic-acid synthase, partial [Muribaculaceae bacterium]|nr:2-succinyl-5-enolpyruvyl-6-hydroxy-3-cyclohexene-1-carboxylic-acid synthase [Muribaculaceae bacterium]